MVTQTQVRLAVRLQVLEEDRRWIYQPEQHQGSFSCCHTSALFLEVSSCAHSQAGSGSGQQLTGPAEAIFTA